MGEHERPDLDGVPDPSVADRVEAKVWASTAAAGAVSGLVAVTNAIQDQPGLLAPLPKLWQSVILMVVTLAGVFTTGYLKTSNRVPPPSIGDAG